MSDVQRVAVSESGTWTEHEAGTHALMPWSKWERVRSFECCRDAERAPRLEAKVIEQRAEIERLWNRILEIRRAIYMNTCGADLWGPRYRRFLEDLDNELKAWEANGE